MNIKNKEKIVRDLVNTFNDRDDLHSAYKHKMKQIISLALGEFLLFYAESSRSMNEISDWVDNFVEERFKPSDE